MVIIGGVKSVLVVYKELRNMVYQEYLHSIIIFIDNILAHLRAKEGQVENLKKCRKGLNSSNCILNLKSIKFWSGARLFE